MAIVTFTAVCVPAPGGSAPVLTWDEEAGDLLPDFTLAMRNPQVGDVVVLRR